MARLFLIALLVCSMLVAPAIGSVSRCSRPIFADKAATCCCRVASDSAEPECCKSQAKSCCRMAADNQTAADDTQATDRQTARDRGASHRCFCKSNRPQPAIPAEQRDESRGQPLLVVGVCRQVPNLPVQESRVARGVGDSAFGLAASQALLCRWLI